MQKHLNCTTSSKICALSLKQKLRKTKLLYKCKLQIAQLKKLFAQQNLNQLLLYESLMLAPADVELFFSAFIFN